LIKDLVIVGAGGLGREMAFLVEQINLDRPSWNVLGFYDDAKPSGLVIDNLPILGNTRSLIADGREVSVLIAIANPLTRQSIVSRLANSSFLFPSFVHPNVNMTGSKNLIGSGSIVAAGCQLTVGIRIGAFVIINLSCTVGHDVKFGDFCSVMPGCNISGNVEIGERTLIGTGAQLLQGLHVSNDCIIGAGAVVRNSLRERGTYVGVPAKRIK
jgi:sugar O-acyltransferase (sialic acid O-acetyltransferase NeuD family)